MNEEMARAAAREYWNSYYKRNSERIKENKRRRYQESKQQKAKKQTEKEVKKA